jgi:Anti-sigma-K factor rskA/Putative zinc-finger
MTDDVCRSRREDIGAYLLGALSDDRRAALMAHLDGCPACRAELEELEGVARLLPLADPVRSAERPVPPPHLRDAIFHRIAHERRLQRRKSRTLAGLVAAAAAVMAIGIFAVATREDDQPTATVSFARSESSARLEYFPWGTQIELSVADLPGEEVYGVWLEKPDGSRVPAGSFWAPKGGEPDITMSAALNFEDCTGIGVTNDDGKTVLYAQIEWSKTGAE